MDGRDVLNKLKGSFLLRKEEAMESIIHQAAMDRQDEVIIARTRYLVYAALIEDINEILNNS
jgi:hypothetical protein